MSPLESFRALHCAGSMISDPESVTALSLIFEKIYLPNDLEIVAEFARRYRFTGDPLKEVQINLESESRHAATHPFGDLSNEERITAYRYLAATALFAQRYALLYGKVFECTYFPDSNPLDVELIARGAPGELNTYRVSPRDVMTFQSEGSENIARLFSRGYIPLVGNFSTKRLFHRSLDDRTSSQIAALLAMDVVHLVLPRMKAVRPSTILEARERLKDHLPPYWSAMLKLTRDLRSRIDADIGNEELRSEVQNLVDDTVRPALIDLKRKISLDRKSWFYRILSPVSNEIRLLAGNPQMTRGQVLTSALALAVDVAMSVSPHSREIDSLKHDSGLTMVLEAEKMFAEDD